MNDIPVFDKVKAYFANRFNEHGSTPRGSDWNSAEAQEKRFDQLLKVVDFSEPFSILDYGCGYAALYEYLVQRNADFQYFGFDIVEDILVAAQKGHPNCPGSHFTNSLDLVPKVDYAVVSGTFNIRLETDFDEWTEYVVHSLDQINEKTEKGFSFNLLTSYSDKEFKKPQLYYAEPCYFFDYCKRHFSRNVALLHDYNLYDFTILVRKVA